MDKNLLNPSSVRLKTEYLHILFITSLLGMIYVVTSALVTIKNSNTLDDVIPFRICKRSTDEVIKEYAIKNAFNLI